MLKIISGHLKGMKVLSPEGEATRPTSARIRESIFNVLASDLEEGTFVDLFAGSGAMGIEAISRGATRCIFVEQDKQACRLISQNLQEVERRFQKQDLPLPQTQVIQLDCFKLPFELTKSLKAPLVVWADPPYEKTIDFLGSPFVQALGENTPSDTLFLAEMDAKAELGSYCKNIGNFICIRNKSMGKTKTVVWQKEKREN